jgi:hypothetical protein
MTETELCGVLISAPAACSLAGDLPCHKPAGHEGWHAHVHQGDGDALIVFYLTSAITRSKTHIKWHKVRVEKPIWPPDMTESMIEAAALEEKPSPAITPVYHSSDGEPCTQCGGLMIRTGACLTCQQCGENMGCG